MNDDDGFTRKQAKANRSLQIGCHESVMSWSRKHNKVDLLQRVVLSEFITKKSLSYLHLS